jgi:hypothetical protein
MKIAVVPRLPEQSGHSKDNLSSIFSQVVNSYYDQTSFMGGGRDKKTTGSSVTNLDMQRQTGPKKKLETIQYFDTAEKKTEEQPARSVVRIKEKTEVFNVPADEPSRKSSSRGRFRKKEYVDHRNDLVKQHEENLRKANSILSLVQTKEALPA